MLQVCAGGYHETCPTLDLHCSHVLRHLWRCLNSSDESLVVVVVVVVVVRTDILIPWWSLMSSIDETSYNGQYYHRALQFTININSFCMLANDRYFHRNLSLVLQGPSYSRKHRAGQSWIVSINLELLWLNILKKKYFEIYLK